MPKITKKEEKAPKAKAAAKTVKPKVAVEEKVKKAEYIYTVGRRKTAIAKVKLFKNGDGEIIVNDKKLEVYFPILQIDKIKNVLKMIGQENKLNVQITTLGGGKNGQAEAIANGIAKALVLLNQNFRKPLKKAGFLSRDARKKERKKPGLKRARRAPQWQKR